MPTGTPVHRCVEKLKREGKTGGSPYAICQSATGQSFATGKPLKKSIMSRSQAAAFLQSKIPILTEMALDGAWGPFQDYWIDTLDEVSRNPRTLYKGNDEDAREFARHLQQIDAYRDRNIYGFDLDSAVANAVADWVMWTLNELSQDSKSLKTKGLSVNTKSLQTLRPVVQEFCNYFGFSSYQTSSVYAGQRSVSCFSRTRGQIPDVPEAIIKDWFEDRGFEVQWVAFHPEYEHLTIALKDSDSKSLGTKELSVKKKSIMSRSQAATFLQSKIPILIEMALDGAWGAFQDYWIDTLDEIPQRQVRQKDSGRDAQVFAMYVQNSLWLNDPNPRADIERNVRSWVNWTINELPPDSKSLKTKSLTAKTKSLDPQEARRVLESKIPLLVQIARDSQWGILYDALSDIFSDLGYSRYDAEARHIRNSAEGMVRQYGQQSELTWRDFFDPYYGHFSNVLIDISHQRGGTKGLTANDARQIIQAKEPLLIQIAETGAWYALQDQLEDLLSELGLNHIPAERVVATMRLGIEGLGYRVRDVVSDDLQDLVNETPRSGTKSSK